MNKTFKMMPLNMKAKTILQLLGITEERINEIIRDVKKENEMQPVSDVVEQAFKICNNANELAAMMFAITDMVEKTILTHKKNKNGK